MASLKELTFAIPGAGRRTLLASLGAELALPQGCALCVLDAQRLEDRAQLALLEELAARSRDRVIFALNKCDLIAGPRTAVTKTLALLRQKGFPQPELYPVCALGAQLFRRTGEELTEQERSQLGELWFRFGPGENSLSAYSVSAAPALHLGSRERSPEQLRLALENTGVPALARALAGPEASLAGKPAEGGVPEAPLPAKAEAEEPTDSPAAPAAPAPEPTPEAERSTDPEPAPEEAPPQPEIPADIDYPAILALAPEADCATLLQLAKTVRDSDGDPDTRERALDTLHEAYMVRELSELRKLTAEAETLDLPALQSLADQINRGPYTVQTRTPYVEQLTQRMDQLQKQNLEALCVGIEEADAKTLAGIRTQLEAVECAEVLKNPYFRRIETRQDALDLEALDRITAGAETMTEKELRAVAVTLEAKNWSPKYVTAYRHRIDLYREAATARELLEQTEELNQMERRELLELRERIQAMELPARFTAAPLARVMERLYRMDMLRLIALQNDFDSLDFEGIDSLRAQVVRGDYSDRARQSYLDRLLTREQALILENCSLRADLVRQLVGQYKLRMSDFAIAGSATDFLERVESFWGGSGQEQARDIPVFLLDNASDYAFSGQRFWYKVGRDLAFIPLEDIDHFQVMRQRLNLNLQIVRKDNTYLLTEARISRSGAERILDFLNECLRRWFEPSIIQGRPRPIRTRPFDPADYTAPVESPLPDENTALAIFKARYAAENLREGNLIREGEESWEQRTRRLLQNFELSERTQLIWYWSAALLGSVKEGVALGPKAIYARSGKQPTQIIPIEEIHELVRTGNRQITVTTVSDQSFRLELPGVMAPLLADYVRTIQLGTLLRQREAANA